MISVLSSRRVLSGFLRRSAAAGALATGIVSFATGALAQEAADAAEEDETEIVVTGTQIRGIAPAGSNVIGVEQEQIAATGASTTNELLSKIPQIGNFFNALPQPGGASAGSNSVSMINRPNLRSLPAGGSSPTLLLIDGHRVVGAGIGVVAVDPDAIPPGALQRVEAITDGGSAVYGSDALGGVINFITRKRFDGVKVSGHYGFAKDYTTWDADIIAGKDWGSGSLYAAYAYSQHDAIFGKDRDYVRNVDWNPASLTYLQGQERSCTAPNVSVGGRNYPRPGLVQSATPNTCDNTDYFTIYPANRQHHVFASLTQQLNDAISIDIKAFYTYRKDEANGGPLRGSVTMTYNANSALRNPNYTAVTPSAGFPGDATANQTVSFDYSPVFGNYALTNDTILKTWNVTPSVTANLGGPGKWQLRALFNYGESTTIYDNIELFGANQTAAAASTNAATALNPYNIAATPAAVLAGLRARNLGIGKHRFTDFRVVLDGALFSLPGGDVRIAVGGEYMRSNYFQRKTEVTNYTLPAPVTYSQSVLSAFGEIQIPIFGEDNAFGGMNSLTFSASGRYDRYNDFGSTFNPKLALTWKPVDWIAINGNWGTSFAAPSPSDQLGPLTSIIRGSRNGSRPNNATYNPPLVAGAEYYAVSLTRGSVAGLKPMSTVSWSIGAKIDPPFVPGLSMSASYYFIHFKDAINSPIGVDPQPFFNQFPSLVIIDPTVAQLEAAALEVIGGLATLDAAVPNWRNANLPGGPRVPVLYDARARNLGVTRIAGVDFDVRYKTETGFGSIDASIGGNVPLKRWSQANPSLPFSDDLATGVPSIRFVAGLGATIGKVRAQATLYHTGGYALSPSANLFNQNRVGAYNTVNLYFRYDVGGTGFGEDLSLTLNVNNLLDADPPILQNGGARENGYANGNTVGRLVQFGVSKKF